MESSEERTHVLKDPVGEQRPAKEGKATSKVSQIEMADPPFGSDPKETGADQNISEQKEGDSDEKEKAEEGGFCSNRYVTNICK